MKFGRTILMTLCVLALASLFPVNAQRAKAKPRAAKPAQPPFSQITQQELTILLSDIAEVNPQLLETLREDPEIRSAQLDNLRQLFAFASEAMNVGIAGYPENRNELENIRLETTAVQYDRHLNKGKPPTAPFEGITAARIAAYWGEDAGSKLPASVKKDRAAKFEQFLEAKVALLRANSPELADKISAEEKEQAREFYAKLNISADEYAKRTAVLPLSLKQKVKLQVKLQQAQFLARAFSERIAPELTASEQEISDYLEEHPELDTGAQRAKAEKILARAKSGEDFAKLANEFTEDPGNKNQTSELQGGLYTNVAKGVFVPPFERAALALEPGQISPDLVESDFGFHIIKLERKSDTYDVRHILIATGVGDPSNPDARSVPVKDYVRKQIEDEKQQELVDRLVHENKVSVPDDIVLPPKDGAKPAAPVRRAPVRKGS